MIQRFAAKPLLEGWGHILKVPKCEIFHLFDFNDFYGVKPL